MSPNAAAGTFQLGYRPSLDGLRGVATLAVMSIKEIPITYVYSNSSLNWKVVRDAFRMWVFMLRTEKIHHFSFSTNSGTPP
jgi:hypothetical protein